MDKKLAETIRKHGLDAIRSLSSILEAAKDKCSDREYEAIKKGVGLSIGKIQMDLLETVYREHPELDDLR